MDLGKTVWERSSGVSILSERTYIAATTLSTVYGLSVTAVLATYLAAHAPTTIIPFLIIGLVIPIIGIFIALGSDSPPVSFFGYNMVVLGLGLIMGPAVHAYNGWVVLQAVLVTGGITVAMSAIGIMYPKSLAHWGGWLFAALLGLILVQVSSLLLIGFGVDPGLLQHPVINYLAAMLFSAYIIYDWNRALRLPHTLDNVIDCSLAIYLDIVNLFLHILKIMGNSSSSGD